MSPNESAGDESIGSEPDSLAKLAQAPSASRLDEKLESVLVGEPGHRFSITRGDHGDPHLFLGPHGAELEGRPGVVIRVFHPKASAAWILVEAASDELETVEIGPGLFAAWLEGGDPDAAYRVRFRPADAPEKVDPSAGDQAPVGGPESELDSSDENSPAEDAPAADTTADTWVQEDAYRFPVSVTDDDLYFFSEGTHLLLWKCLGARPWSHAGVAGWSFTVWAPNARRVGVVGDFNGWDGRVHAMRRLGSSGMWEIFIPGMISGEIYKFEILDPHGNRWLRADPMARWAEVPPQTASRTFESSYAWQDHEWMAAHPQRDVRREPMAVYEVHLGSWLKDHDPEQEVTYRDLAPKLVEHARSLGFNYLELLPVAEHPFDGSWGYQITGYFAPTSRYGTPDDFRFFVDYCHRHGMGVIVDWVPAHFVKDAHGLGRFDGTALYEHEDPRRGEHPDWGTYIFNYGRFEVRNFLLANALYWLEELHVDGLRVDAVASMLYLDYSREADQWLPNEHGGRENLAAIALLQDVNRQIEEHFPGRFTVAEESTAWPGITRSVAEGGLGFNLKWNMGWMHDTLDYFGIDPFFRPHHHDKLTFAMVYEYSEAFINPLSHDEVVHGKGSLHRRMPGDSWRKFANLRALLTYQYARPGKVLLFMGSELASPREWNHEASLEWQLLEKPEHRKFHDFLGELGKLYVDARSLWLLDHQKDGFQWVACHDREMSIFCFARWADLLPEDAASERLSGADPGDEKTGTPRTGEHLLVVLNLTPVPHETYSVGAPMSGTYRVLLSSDDARFGGSDFPRADAWVTEDEPLDDCAQRLTLTLPPLSAMILGHEPGPSRQPTKKIEDVKTEERPPVKPAEAAGAVGAVVGEGPGVSKASPRKTKKTKKAPTSKRKQGNDADS